MRHSIIQRRSEGSSHRLGPRRRVTGALLAAAVVAASTGQAATLTLPGAAHAPGDSGTSWVSDLVVLNASRDLSTDVAVRFTSYEGVESLSTVFTLAPLELVALQDVVGATFGREDVGFLTVSSDRAVAAAQRTFNSYAGGGTFGQHIPAIEAASGTVYLTGMRGGDLRTNLGFVNTGGETLTLDVDVAAGGTVELAAGSGIQLNRVEEWEEFDPLGGVWTGGRALSVPRLRQRGRRDLG